MLEGFRPGVMERLGLGPDALLAVNPKLVYARMTGWGQDGPLAPRAGHDIDYIALSGVLHAIGRAGGAPCLRSTWSAISAAAASLLGVRHRVCAGRGASLRQGTGHRRRDGGRRLAAVERCSRGCRRAAGGARSRGENILDTGAPWYDVYETSDHRFVAVRAIEPSFTPSFWIDSTSRTRHCPDQHERAQWPALRQAFRGGVFD